MAVVKMNFLSKSLGMQTNVTICLPSFSFADLMQGSKDFYVPGIKYQVLYLLHGASGDDSDYVNFSNITRYADEKKVVVVMPCDYNASYTDSERGAKYYSYVARELPQLMRAYFPVSDRREDTFVGGLSMGGQGAMKVAIMNPDVFSACLCMSGAAADPDTIGTRKNNMRFGDDEYCASMPSVTDLYGDPAQFKGSKHDVWHYAKKNVEEGKPLPRFYFTVGDKDFAVKGVEDAYHYLSSLGYDASYDLVPGYAHEWDFWDLTLRKTFNGWFGFRGSPYYPEEA